MILGIDAGNDRVKIFGERGEMSFISLLGEYRERKLVSNFSKDDMIYEYKNKKGFAGTLALYESDYAISRLGDDKAHDDLLIRVLIALHRYCEDTEFQIVVGQPISKHDDRHKEKIKKLLSGKHEFILNGSEKIINIQRVEVAAEGAAAFWSFPKANLIRILDIGSGTVNGASLLNGNYLDRGSFTIKEGLNSTDNIDLSQFARKIALTALKKWEVDDAVYLVGGGAEKLYPHLKEHLFNLHISKPFARNGALRAEHKPIFANAIGFYEIAKVVFK